MPGEYEAKNSHLLFGRRFCPALRERARAIMPQKRAHCAHTGADPAFLVTGNTAWRPYRSRFRRVGEVTVVTEILKLSILFLRPVGAGVHDVLRSHGLRRGLNSFTALRLLRDCLWPRVWKMLSACRAPRVSTLSRDLGTRGRSHTDSHAAVFRTFMTRIFGVVDVHQAWLRKNSAFH